MQRVKQETAVFLKGLFLSLLAAVVFVAYGSMKVIAKFDYSEYLVPLLVGLIMWVLVYIVILILGRWVDKLDIDLWVLLIASLILGYFLTLVGGYLIPKTWIVLDNTDDFRLAVGFVYAVILIVSRYKFERFLKGDLFS